jgi:hypothetical protein
MSFSGFAPEQARAETSQSAVRWVTAGKFFGH